TLLAPGGAVAIGLPSLDGPSFAAEGIHWREVKPPEHVSLPTAAGIHALCTSVDLEVLTVIAHFAVPWRSRRGRRALAWVEGAVPSSRATRAAGAAVRSVERARNLLRPSAPWAQDYVTWIAGRRGRP